MKKILPYIIISVLAFLLLTQKCSSDNNGSNIISSDTVYVTTTVTDTIEIERTVVKVDTIMVPTLVKEEVLEDSTVRRTYSDTTQLADKFQGFYTAIVDGHLINISIGYEDNRPERIINNTITNEKTITNTIAPSGLYIGPVLSSNGTIGIGGGYLKNKWSFGYQFVDKSHQATVKYKLF